MFERSGSKFRIWRGVEGPLVLRVSCLLFRVRFSCLFGCRISVSGFQFPMVEPPKDYTLPKVPSPPRRDMTPAGKRFELLPLR